MLSRLCFTSSDVLIRCNACTVLLVNKRLHATLLSLSLHPRLHCFGLTSVGFGDYERGRGKSGGGRVVGGRSVFLSLVFFRLFICFKPTVRGRFTKKVIYRSNKISKYIKSTSFRTVKPVKK
jgi:hypothetical protein